jgi:hypothetical protein
LEIWFSKNILTVKKLNEKMPPFCLLDLEGWGRQKGRERREKKRGKEEREDRRFNGI